MQRILFVVGLVLVNGRPFEEFDCQDPELQQDFDVNRYLGRWYEIWKDPTANFDIGQKCTTAFYSLRDDGLIRVQNTGLLWNGGIDQAIGRAFCEESNCGVSFFADFFGDYRVVSTDYEKYAIVYSCSRPGVNHNELLWILGRDG